MDSIDLALWDSNDRRAIALKDRLDMFAGEFGATLLPKVLKLPIRAHDAVFLSFDECEEAIIETAKAVRQSGEMTFIVLVNDRKRNLYPLFRPKIRPSGVIFRPVQNSDIREVISEISDELNRISQSIATDLFIFKAEGTTRRIPLMDILFFEANLKKVIIHTKGREIAYYDSIENLNISLPDYFIRCHRSYIVNTSVIQSMSRVGMELNLTGGVRIPFSRPYRKRIIQIFNCPVSPDCKQANPNVTA
jgi:DNA-binding LytR/AlgR family response regulator